MHNSQANPILPQPDRGKTAEVLAHLEKIVREGLRHGFFKCSIKCDVISGGKRLLVIRSSQSHKFTIPEDELPRRRTP